MKHKSTELKRRGAETWAAQSSGIDAVLLTKLARQVQSIASRVAALRHGAARSENVVVLSESRRARNTKPEFGRPSILSLSLLVTMTTIFAGVFLISLGKLEIEREHPQRHSDEPDIQRAPPAPSAPTPERLPRGGFTLVTGSFETMGQVIDGDTLAAGSRRIRLHGIDAPEIGQSCHRRANAVDCGSLAAEILTIFLAGHRVTCRSVDVDRYQREVATCFLRDGTDVNRHMVASGWAIAYRRYSRTYEQDEAYARTHRLGIWAGSLVPPAEWRAGIR